MNREGATPRRRALRWLFGGDALAVGAAVLFATQTSPGQTPWLTSLLILTWALLPVVIADFLRARGWPKDDRRSFVLASTIALLTVGLGYAGFVLIRDAAPADAPLFLGTALLALLTWSLFFLSFLPPVYRLLDFLTGGLILMGLLERRPDAVFLIPVWILGLAISAQTRHQLYDLHPHEDRPPLDLVRNGLSGAFLAAVIGLTFWWGFGFLYSRLDEPHLATLRDRGVGAYSDLDDDSRGRPPGFDRAPRQPSHRNIGLGESMRLSDIEKAAGDPRTMLRLAPLNADGTVAEASGDETPGRKMLMRKVSYEIFNPRTNEWLRGPYEPQTRQWNSRRPIRRIPARRGAARERWRVTIVSPGIRSLLLPYACLQFMPPSEAQDGAEFLVYGSGEIVPDLEDIPTGSHYDIEFETPRTEATTLAKDARVLRRISDRLRTIPTRSQINVDLKEVARRVMGPHRSLSQKVDALGAYFRREFSYDANLDWLPEDSSRNFEFFMTKSRRGDCVYLATAAVLLFRAHGIPARMVSGYVGSDFDPAAKDFRIINARAHAWLEIPLTSGRWAAIDPTQWVDGSEVIPALTASKQEFSRTGGGLRLFPDLAILAGVALLLLFARRLTRLEGSDAEKEQPFVMPAMAPIAALQAIPETDLRRALLVEYENLQQKLGKRRRHRRPHQTPREHAEMWAGEDPKLREALTTVETLIDRAVYGHGTIESQDLAEFTGACRVVRRRLR